MLTAKVGAIVRTFGSGAFNELASAQMPARLAFRVGGLVSAAGEQYERYEKMRISRCEELGKLDKESNTYKFPDAETERRFNAEMAELSESEVELVATRIKVSELEKGGVRLTPTAAITLSWALEDDTEPADPKGEG